MSRKRPLIAVTGSEGTGRFMWWFNKLSVWLAGGRAVRLVPNSHQPEDWHKFDGLVLGGGDDISAELYHGEIYLGVKVDPARDALEQDLLSHVRDRTVPVLGICRGAQMMNIYRGGSLYTDMKEMLGVEKRRTVLPRTTVHLVNGSKTAEIFEHEVLRVNSLHHQSIDRLGERLEVVGYDDDGIVQAIEDPGTRFFLGVQWHPEFLALGRIQRRLYRALVKAAREDRQIYEEARSEKRSAADPPA